ncbi:MAG: hypothetical protein RSI32_04900 [Clostridia bacterium]
MPQLVSAMDCQSPLPVLKYVADAKSTFWMVHNTDGTIEFSEAQLNEKLIYDG